jgi:gamma-glutamyl hercynylcysteine S-oxide synthase
MMRAQSVREALTLRMSAVRKRTLWLLDQVPEAFLRRRVHHFYSPIGWHFGHVGRTEEYWTICAALGGRPTDDTLSFLFADTPENPKDQRVHIPDRDGIRRYLTETRERVLGALADADLEGGNPFLQGGFAWEFAIQHECQHQETVAEMMQLIQREAVGATPEDPVEEWPEWRPGRPKRALELSGGAFCMGSDDPRCYDNEREPHHVDLRPFRLDDTPVTAFEWAEFIEDGGYRRSDLWSEEGWAWREAEGADLPEYWIRLDGRYASFAPFGLRPVHPDEPASSLSWFEADAYARWKGRRLPTEREWEHAAASSGTDVRRYPWGDQEPSDELAIYGLSNWGPAPVGSRPGGQAASGALDLAGNVWEWTSSPFLPYPGFRAFPYDGYSKSHMDGRHYSCRGGSWATSGPILRCTFRNWYVPGYRQGLLGVRLADD